MRQLRSVLWTTMLSCLLPQIQQTFQRLLMQCNPKTSQDMNACMLRDFELCEVHHALKQIYPLKALGPDSMPPSFQHFWPTVGNLVTKTVLDFLNFGVIPPKFNETHIFWFQKLVV